MTPRTMASRSSIPYLLPSGNIVVPEGRRLARKEFTANLRGTLIHVRKYDVVIENFGKTYFFEREKVRWIFH